MFIKKTHKIYYSLNEVIEKFREVQPNKFTDIGCGVCFIKFKEDLDVSKVEKFLKYYCIENSWSPDLPLETFFKYFNGDKEDIEFSNFIVDQYSKFGSISGGNHFIEYGRTSDNQNYFIIHSGNNGIYEYLYKRFGSSKAIFISKLIAIENRKEIMNKLIYIFKIRNIEKKFDQVHYNAIKVDSNSDYRLLRGVSRADESNGNIFLNGPWKKSLLIYPNKNAEYVSHGFEEIVFGEVNYKNKKNYFNKNYFREYKEIPIYEEIKSYLELNPLVISRPIGIF